MTVGELLLLNKEKYTRAFLIEKDEETKVANFKEIKEETIDKELIGVEATDYFLLDKDSIEEIFGNSNELKLDDKDQSLIIGL